MGKSAAELAKQFTENNNSGRTKSLRIASKVPTPETTPTKGGRHKTAPKEKTEIEEASQVPDYTNRILSYNDPKPVAQDMVLLRITIMNKRSMRFYLSFLIMRIPSNKPTGAP
jgi:hypothetical protein